MIKKFMLFLIVIASLSSTAFAMEVGATAGLFKPTSSDLGNGVYMSVYASDSIVPNLIDFKIQAVRITSDLESKYDLTDEYKPKLTTIGGSALVIARAPIVLFDLYAGAGWGYYKNRVKRSDSTENYYSNGLVLQAGTGVSFSIINLGFEVNHFENKVKGVQLGGTSLSLKLGLSF